MDFLSEEESRAMFAEMNRVLKTGGEALLTLPQSWRLTGEYAEALKRLGFEIEVAPMRAAHTATDAWIESIKQHYGNTSMGNEIAEEVRRMKSKQFSVLRIRKARDFSADLAGVPLELFKLEKTDTGQRGKTTGDKPFDFGPQATHRWLEVLRWVVQDWQPGDMRAYDPAAQTVTREEISAQLFPEIETEQALEKLHDLRAIFSSAQENGNDYEKIADFYTYWKAGFQQFRRDDVERLAQLYRRGPPKNGHPPSPISFQDLLRKLESRADYFAGLNGGRSADTYEHFERNQTLEKQSREKIAELREFLDKLLRTHALAPLAIPGDQKGRYGFYEHFAVLQNAGAVETAWSPRLIAGLDWFFKKIHKPGDNAVAAMLENPPELPEAPAVFQTTSAP